MSRKPLSTLPLSPFTRDLAASPKKTSSRRSSLALTMSRSPFHAATSTTPRSGPLSTLYEAPKPASPRTVDASPRGMMAAEQRLVEEPGEDDDVPPTPPRRLLDLFLQSAGKSGISSAGNGSGSRSRTGSPAPASPGGVGVPASPRTRKEEEDSPPAWSFYEDVDEDASLVGSTLQHATSGEQMVDLEDDSAARTNDENSRPLQQVRRRSASLLSQSIAPDPVPDGPVATTTTAALSPRTRPNIPPISIAPPTTFLATANPATPPDSASPTSPALFPSWIETTSAPSAFGDGGNSSFEAKNSSALLPGFALAFSPRKRPSLGEGGGDEKRARMGLSEEE